MQSFTYFIGAHRYTTIGGMCALRGLSCGIDVYLWQPKGEPTLPLGYAEHTYPIQSGRGFNRNRVLAKRQKERLKYGC